MKMMKHPVSYIGAALLGMAALSACGDNFTYPPVIMPPAVEVTPTSTLEQFKDSYWSAITAPQTVGTVGEDGDSLIFVGRVCSSDETGNIYKNIIIQSRNEAGEQVAVTFSVNDYDLYQLFPFGQEVAVYATGLQIGGYRGLFQFGAVSGSDMTFMDVSLFQEHVFRTGSALPEPAKVDTTLATIPEIIAAKSDAASLRLWQSRLVRINNVSFVEAGQPFAGMQSVSRNITDEQGNKLIVRNSSYASFSDEPMPYGKGSITGILSYFGSDWQLLLIDAAGCQGFDGVAPEPVPDAEPSGDGTEASPYNVARALEIATAMADGQEKEAYVKGVITEITDLSTSFGNATYKIADAVGGKSLGVYRGYWFNGDKFTSEDQLKVGAEVVVTGKLVNFKGNTPQFTTGNRIVSYNGQTSGGDTPTPPAGEQTIFSALSDALTEMPADWTLDNVSLGDGLSYVWSWKTYNDKGYLNASAFMNSAAIPSEAYAVSPVIDLTGATGCTVSFDHAAKFQTTLRKLCGVVAREEGATAWTDLSGITWPEAGSWTFVNSGAISLAAFDGKKVQVAFRYKSDATGADTWEIKNFTVNGKK